MLNLDTRAAVAAFAALAAAPLLGMAMVHGARLLMLGVVVIGVELLLVLRPRLGVYAVLLGGYWDFFFVPTGVAMLGIGDLMTFAVLPAWLLRVLVRRDLTYRPPRYVWLIAIYVGLATASLVTGVQPASAYGTFARNMTYLVAMLAVVDIARSADILERSLWLMVLCALGHVIIAFYLDAGSHRLGGLVEQPNLLGVLLAMGALPAAALLQRADSQAAKVFLGATLSLLLIGVLLTISRGTYIGLAVAFAWWMRRQRQAFVIGLLGVGLLMFVFSQVGDRADRIERRLELDDSSVDGRRATYENALRAAVTHPLLGVGYGQFTKLHKAGVDVTAERGRGSHSFYLGVLAATGVPSALALFGFVGLQALRLWRRQRRRAHRTSVVAAHERWLLGVFQALILYHGLSLMVRGAGRVLEWVLLGLYIAASMLPEADEDEEDHGTAGDPLASPEGAPLS